jgi:hypothetical protein
MPVTFPPEEPFPDRRIDEIQPQDPDTLWLIDHLWLREGVGMLGAPPKSWCAFSYVECPRWFRSPSGFDGSSLTITEELAVSCIALPKPG